MYPNNKFKVKSLSKTNHWKQNATTIMNMQSLDKNSYDVTFIFPNDITKKIKVNKNEYISDAAVNQGIDNLPSSCNSGVCVTCTAKLLEGSVIHDHTFLSTKEEKAGFLLTCRTSVTSDCTIETHQEDALLEL